MRLSQKTFAWRPIISLLLLQLVIPAISFAQTGPSAGFAPSIWMSRSHVVAGESVNIFTVLYNSSEGSISGDAVMEVDGSPIGTKGFTLASGETQVVSWPWTAKVGSHTVSARIEKAVGVSENTNVLKQTTGNITVSINAPPPSSPAAQVLSTVTSAIETGVASTAPAVLSAANTLFNATESLREQAKTALEKQLAENTPANAKVQPRQLAGTSGNTSPEAGNSTAGTVADTPLISRALRYMAAAGLAVVSSRTLFYLSLALMLLLLIKIVLAFFRAGKRREWSD